MKFRNKEGIPSQKLEVSISGLKKMYDLNNKEFSDWVVDVVGNTNGYIPFSYPYGFTKKELNWIIKMWESVSTNKVEFEKI